MDQIKIGKFISSRRKEQGLTQRQLAEKLAVSDKTISKWECGNGLPEVSLMLPLCEVLSISVNELLCGERIVNDDYKQKAEDKMMELIKERNENKKKLILSAVICFITVLSSCILVMVSGLSTEFTTLTRIGLIVSAVVIIICGIACAVALEFDAGKYECIKCGHKFVPTVTEYVNAAHTITRRHLKCPNCSKKSWCIRRLG